MVSKLNSYSRILSRQSLDLPSHLRFRQSTQYFHEQVQNREPSRQNRPLSTRNIDLQKKESQPSKWPFWKKAMVAVASGAAIGIFLRIFFPLKYCHTNEAGGALCKVFPSGQFIKINAPCMLGGMFHVLTYTMGALDQFNPKKHAGITIEYGNNTPNYDSSKGSNWWEYFFEPVKIGDAKEQVTKTFTCNDELELSSFIEGSALYENQGISREHANELILEYFKLKPDLQKEIDLFADTHLTGTYVIGVHYRGTDKICNPDGSNKTSKQGLKCEAKYVSYEEVIKAIRETIDQKKLTHFKIFAASDDQHFIDHLASAFPGKTAYTDAKRSKNGEPIHLNSDNPYQMGKDAIKDCYLLARSQLVIRTSSILNTFASFINPKMELITLSKKHFNP